MGCSNLPKPVFVETNLGTRFAAPVYSDMRIEEFKRELENMHLNCFPEFGRIRANALMVKQKSRYYHLSESLPLKYAFPNSNGTWFLQMDANPDPRNISDRTKSLTRNGDEIHNLNSAANVTDPIVLRDPLMCSNKKRIKCKRKKLDEKGFLLLPTFFYILKRNKKRKNVKRKHGKWDTNVVTEAVSETFAESVSVSGIISKYFSDYDEVVSNPFSIVRRRHECKYPKFRNPSFDQASREKQKTAQVGKRVLVALDNLGLSPSNQRPALSLCKGGLGKSPSREPACGVRNLAFEMTEESD